jgi:hypothetical protein
MERDPLQDREKSDNKKRNNEWKGILYKIERRIIIKKEIMNRERDIWCFYIQFTTRYPVVAHNNLCSIKLVHSDQLVVQSLN